jgi:hypothetical protein
MLCFLAAPSRGGSPQLCQPDPYLTLLRVVCQLSFVLAVQREPLKQTLSSSEGFLLQRRDLCYRQPDDQMPPLGRTKHWIVPASMKRWA